MLKERRDDFRVDETVDEGTRHLQFARNKIEAVEQEFAQIMQELADYGKRADERLPRDAKRDDGAEERMAMARHGFGASTGQWQQEPEVFAIYMPSGEPLSSPAGL